jgi:hypothetical protein
MVSQLTRTSRRQVDSSSIAPLEKALGHPPEHRQERQPPPAVYAKRKKRCQNAEADDQLDHASQKPLPSLAGADVGDA